MNDAAKTSFHTTTHIHRVSLGVVVSLAVTLAITAGARPLVAQVREEQLANIDFVVQEAIKAGKCPGAVVLVGHRGKVVYRRGFGERSLVPHRALMTTDTIFDLASLTKVIATTTAVMQLVEQGRIRLLDPVTEYWPEFNTRGKDVITVRELLTHFSGLRPDLDLKPEWSGYDTAMQRILAEEPVAVPGTRFIYSDINFETLGEIVRRVSGEPLDVYCAEHIFRPLGMKDTNFRPPASQYERIAPTEQWNGRMLLGEVHDPTARFMGGVAGHAGLFSTADDLSIFAQMLLDGGTYLGTRVLSPLSVEKMTAPQSPPGKIAVRGLGWDLDSPYASTRGEFFPLGSYGHTGWTGTSIWIDPVSKTYVIVLSNRVHPDGRGDVVSLRARVSTIVAASLGLEGSRAILASRSPITGPTELAQSYRIQPLRNGRVLTGVDVLVAEKFAPLAGLRVALITNHTGRDRGGRSTIDILHKAPRVRLKAILGPEHGFQGTAAEGTPVPSGKDPVTGLPVYSLYGGTLRPTEKMLNGIDALVFDIQDAGARFYTYITTLGYAMEAAAKEGIPIYVLDRPDPINGLAVEGPILDPDQISFVGYFPMPVRHGMTVGELAEMFNRENNIGANLHVIKMQGWERGDWFDETGLVWVNPSPNLRSLTAAALYPGVAMAEGANVSVGRGTGTPFELLGAPWIDARQFADYLNERRIQGVRFVPVDFTPESGPFARQACHGINFVLVDRDALNSPELGVELLGALHHLYPEQFQLEKTLPLVGARWVLEDLKKGRDPRAIVLHSYEPLEPFRQMRIKYLLYP
ncbi:MAG: exo-beta-N-acetylmuramidase NamZ domain-containing protein [Terriglobia bacterium]